MEIKINNNTWEITEHSKEEMLEEYQKNHPDGLACFGLTFYGKHEIWLNKDMCEDERILTLRHELMHAYIWSIGCCNYSQFDEEDVCNLSSKSAYLINEIIDKYFKEN